MKLGVIPRMKCSDCGDTTHTYGAHNDSIYCKSCICEHCDLGGHLNNIGQPKCNNVHGLIKRDGKTLCIGHYKFLQKFCRVCGTPRSKYWTPAYDDWYYCPMHKPLPHEQRREIRKILGNELPNDIISHICTFLPIEY